MREISPLRLRSVFAAYGSPLLVACFSAKYQASNVGMQ
jgi:hypothetical protein